MKRHVVMPDLGAAVPVDAPSQVPAPDGPVRARRPTLSLPQQKNAFTSEGAPAPAEPATDKAVP